MGNSQSYIISDVKCEIFGDFVYVAQILYVQICVSTQRVVLGVFYIFLMIPKHKHEAFCAELSCKI